jgi:23S rRNA pseudouridine2605 synthase
VKPAPRDFHASSEGKVPYKRSSNEGASFDKPSSQRFRPSSNKISYGGGNKDSRRPVKPAPRDFHAFSEGKAPYKRGSNEGASFDNPSPPRFRSSSNKTSYGGGEKDFRRPVRSAPRDFHASSEGKAPYKRGSNEGASFDKPSSQRFRSSSNKTSYGGGEKDFRRPVRSAPRDFRGTNDEKLHKVLAALGIGSRRSVELLIEQGRVRVNGKVARIGMRVTPRASLTVNGQVVRRRAATARLLCYHKPIGKMVERGADNSVFSDLPLVTGGRWVNIGRLDVNSEGLLLFSTDGELVQQMAHPRYAVEREYLARVDGELTPEQIKAINSGVLVDGKPLKPAHFSFHRSAEGRNQWYRVILTEGRNRAVRRLFLHVERQVSRLIRLRMGEFSLPRDLAAGHWRELVIDRESMLGTNRNNSHD